jgi:hypothetical protein
MVSISSMSQGKTGIPLPSSSPQMTLTMFRFAPGSLTADGQRVAIYYTNLHDRLVRPLLAADQPQAPPTVRNALRTIDTHVTHYIDAARLPLKAA